MHRIGDGLLLVTGDECGDDNIGTDRHADEGVDEEINDGAVCTDRGLCGTGNEMPDDRGIGRVKKLLQDTGQCERKSKHDELLKKWPVKHVYLVRLSILRHEDLLI